jgi:hypothetical protein
LCAVACTALALAVPGHARACGAAGYTYAGVGSSSVAFGIRTTLTAAAAPNVQGGHVAGWVGVGGVGLGPHGSNEWIQVGLSAFPGSGESNLYYEVARPGRAPEYTEVATALPAGLARSIAVLEMAHRRNWWRVWVNGTAVSRPVHLPGSHGAWRPIAAAESWAGTGRACNTFAYRFQAVSIAARQGGSWHRLIGGYTFHDAAYQVVRAGAGNFVAKSSAGDTRGTTDVTP